MQTNQSYLWLKTFSFLLVSIFLSCSFATEKKYTFGKPYYPQQNIFNEEDNPQFESGEPYIVLDWIGNALGFLSKLIINDSRMSNHKISEETKQYLKNYIIENNMKDVKVRFNQYAPIEDLKQLWRSDNVNPVLKYSLGLINWFFSALFPARIFSGCPIPYVCSGDHYNPYSNTINLYSDIPTVVLHEGGHAKDFSARKYKSFYSLGYSVPFFGALYPEARATDDAIRYLRYKCDRKVELLAYKTVYPAYSTYVFGQILGIASAVPGHIVGSSKASKFLREEVPECKLAYEMELNRSDTKQK
ncbi:hypothetical protein LPTSP3_g28660 [Leptospira kobayashii]|uniref:Lipoprotein n=1 Tax=Leptospira kobayashii TaxID=1917830 RepID=A0ABM7ULR7_9LEPT|nr:hypothetical protein [Leptospira kobayashii]BDA79936.1 hypothetical protein LPTSP3_g28660 [Leptospira kobayashii]